MLFAIMMNILNNMFNNMHFILLRLIELIIQLHHLFYRMIHDDDDKFHYSIPIRLNIDIVSNLLENCVLFFVD